MSHERAERIADFIGPLRVEPGSKVRLDRDFDPRYKAGLKKRDGIELLRTGVSMLAEYQERLAAQDTYGVLLCLQALDAGGKDWNDPPRDERRQSPGRTGQQLQGALRRGTRPRLPVALRPAAAHAGRSTATSRLGATRRFSSARVHPRTWSGRSCRTTHSGRAYGAGATGRSTTGSATSRTTGSRW